MYNNVLQLVRIIQIERMNEEDLHSFTAKTFYGLENILADELKMIGAKQIKTANRAVYFAGNKELLYKANYQLHTATSILKPIHIFSAKNDEELYRKVQELDWSKILSLKKTFSIESTVYSSVFKHSQYATLKTKDAIVDQFRKMTNLRPSVDTRDPDFLINLHISENLCTISLNSSGEPLFKRGYRVATQEAPLNEVLAAGLIALSGWSPDKHLIDPMCGSATILIEAALIANKVPPGIFRKKFGFENWFDYDKELFNYVKTSVENKNKINTLSRFIGNDISAEAIAYAKQNIKNNCLHDVIELNSGEFQYFAPPVESGFVITNPPYGERLKKEDINDFYKSMGDILKNKYKNFVVWILSSNLQAMKFIGLHPSKKYKLLNASLECTFNQYEIYEGTRKRK